MKKSLLLLLLITAFVSCSDDKTTTTDFKIDPSATISIKPATGVKMRSANSTHLTAIEIVKQTSLICLRDTIGETWTRTFIPNQRDTISSTPKLLMWATDVISITGDLQTGFLGNFLQARDVVFVRSLTPNDIHRNLDTIAYIPNSILREAETEIISAYTAKNIDSCYNIFNTSYTFIPITGEEWRALKASNQQ